MTIENRRSQKDLFASLRHVAIIGVLLIGICFVLFPKSSAEAHATLLEMDPAEDVVIDDPPSTLTLRFNEPIEHDLAMVTVYDGNGDPVFTGNPDDGVEEAPRMDFSLPELNEGTYTVKWNVVSADGHPVSDSYAFAVGEPTEGGVEAVDDNDSEGALIAARVIPEGLLLLGAGLFWFGWLAERRQFPALDTLWRSGRWIGAVVIALGTIAELITYSLSLPPGIIEVIFNGRWELITQFPFILMLLAQIFFLVLLFIPGMERGWYLALWLALAVTPAFGGHVWGMQHPFVALIPRVIHQMAIAFWLGALAYVILLLIGQKRRGASISWQAFRPFFVNKMMVTSGLVVASGVVMVFLQTGFTAVFADWQTWSLVVILKVVLTLAMLSMALFQTLKWKRTGNFTTGRVVRSEWIVGLIVIVCGVWMSQISYPIAVETYDETLTTDHVEADVHIDQLQSGDQTMTASIAELDGEDPDEVTAEVSMPQHDMGSDTLAMEQNDAGHYVVDLPFTMSGTWVLEITATYPDGEEKEWEDDIFIAGEGN